MSKGPPPPATRFGPPTRTVQAAAAPRPAPAPPPPPTRFGVASVQAAAAPASHAAIAPPPPRFGAPSSAQAARPQSPPTVAPPPTRFTPHVAQPVQASAPAPTMAPPPTRFGPATPPVQMRPATTVQRTSGYDSEDEMVHNHKKKKTKKGNNLSENKVAGNIFEEDTFNFFLEKDDYFVNDMNDVKQNFPGIDFAVINDLGQVSFPQCKNHGNNVDAYLRDIDKSNQMALKFAKGVTGTQQKGAPTQLNQKFSTLVKQISDPNLTKIHKNIIKEQDDLDEDSKIIETISKKITFPVPSDVYEEIEENHTGYLDKVFPLKHDSAWFKRVKERIPYIKSRKKSQDEDDDDYEPEEETKTIPRKKQSTIKKKKEKKSGVKRKRRDK